MVAIVFTVLASVVFAGAGMLIMHAENRRDDRLYAALQAPARGRHHRGGPAWTPAAACTA